MGQDFRHFWHSPLKEIHHVLNGSTRRLVRERDERMSLAWHTAKLTAYAPQKSRDFMPLKDLIGVKPKARPTQTAEQQQVVVRGWLANRKKR